MDPFRIPPAVGQFPQDSGGRTFFEFAFFLVHNGGGGRSDATDVLQNEEPRIAIVCNSDDLEEKTGSFAVKPSASAGNGQVLAWESGNDAIHFATPLSSVEGGNVGPDRCRIHGAFFHARNHDAGGVSFPLNVANGAIRDAQIVEPSSQSFAEHADAGEELDSVQGM
jgi:hypothetical protein